MTDLESLRNQLRTFAADRDWDQFHSPKNLAAALAVEEIGRASCRERVLFEV